MSFQLMQDCNDMSCDMSSTEHAVLMVLCRYADDDGNNCFPSTAEIARCSHFAVLPVRKAIAGLEASGWIKSQQESGKKRFFTVDVAKIRGVLPFPNQVGGINQHPRIDRYGGIDQTVGIDQHPDPVLINIPTPYQSIPRKEHIKEQEKDKVSCALPAGSSAADLCPSVDEFCLANDYPVEAPKTTKQTKTKKPKAITHPLDLESIPDDYTEYCQEVRPDLVPARVFAAFKAYWTKGKGKGTLKSDKNWFQSWMNWVKKEDEVRTRNTKPIAVEEFSDDRYANAMNPDGSLNWD